MCWNVATAAGVALGAKQEEVAGDEVEEVVGPHDEDAGSLVSAKEEKDLQVPLLFYSPAF